MPKGAKIVFAATIASIICIAIGTTTRSSIMIGFSVVLIVGTIVYAMIFISRENGGGIKAAKLDMSLYGKYIPLLADQRTKQHPDVQRLLQYTEVQRVFFDASSLSSPSTANDEHVRELLAVFDEMLAQAAIDGTVYGAQSSVTSTIDPMQIVKQEQQKQKNTPRRKIGTILYYAGLAMFLLPLGMIFFMAMNIGEATASLKAMSFILTAGAPLGMALIIAGSIIRRK